MDRRTALKNITMGLGYTVATPTILNVLASCNAEKETWTPLFFSKEEKHIVTHLVDVILPTSDTPGALDVNIPQFIDMMYHDIEKTQNQELFKQGANIFIQKFGSPVLEGKKEDFEKSLASYFNIPEEETKNILRDQRRPVEKINTSEKENYALYKFLISVRSYTLLGYFTSEKVGKEVLIYDPIPGSYQACIPVEEATNGRAWTL